MKFSIISIFPDMFSSYLDESILARAKEKGLLETEIIDPRQFADDKHNKVDDIPYGGGPGMVFKAEPLLKAVESLGLKKDRKVQIINFSPSGIQFSNQKALEYSIDVEHLVLICGRYEGVDARVVHALKDEYGSARVQEISVGPYVLTGGELPAMIIIDAVARQIPGVLGNESSPEEKRTASSEVYTRPEILKWNEKEYSVPEVLLSGHHKNIEEWRKGKASPSEEGDA